MRGKNGRNVVRLHSGKNRLSRILTEATKTKNGRRNGLQLLCKKIGGVEVKPHIMRIIDEEVLVLRRGKRQNMTILVGGHEFRPVGRGSVSKLKTWAAYAVDRQVSGVMYGQPKVFFNQL